MKQLKNIRLLFNIAALYDGILGLAFLFAGAQLFTHFQVTPPNHFGYIHFPAMLLIVFGLMFFAVARKPTENRNLIPYGILLKISYCATVFYHWFSTDIPNIWKPFAILDFAFIALFIWAYRALTNDSDSASSGS
jgi:predicted membrane channel-forming protein YqfA (hemolysin III family)